MFLFSEIKTFLWYSAANFRLRGQTDAESLVSPGCADARCTCGLRAPYGAAER
jgi:hypothetical protein